MKRLLVAASTLALGACAGTLPPVPDLRPAPEGWTSAAAIAPEVEDRWWLTFGDPVLDDLVARADLGDDPAIAEARLSEASARLGSARARLRPELAGSGQGEASRVDDLEQDQIRGLARIAWSPDLTGALDARARAAAATLSAEAARTSAARQATRATAVRLYIALREAQARLETAEASVTALSSLLDLAGSRERAGLGSGLDTVAVRAQLASARLQPVVARAAADEARLGMEALLGLPAGSLAQTLIEGPKGPPVPDNAPALDAPLSVLARRPDLIAAERELAASGFEADAARRDFWPSLSLSAALGGQSVDPETPFSVSGGLAQVSAGLIAPLVSFGRLKSARDAADARRVTAALIYRRAATQALSEVERALVGLRSAETRVRLAMEAETIGQDRLALTTARYRSGLSAQLDALVAEEALAQTRASLVGARGELARARVALSIAMGLGAA